MEDLKLEQGFNTFGLEMNWEDNKVDLTNVSAYKDVPGIRRAFDANAKFILAFLAEMHETDGKLYKGDNVIDAYFGKDDPGLMEDIWNSVRRWAVVAFK
ncbi:hypothetical protein HOI26_01165 [Candidatus Woesearchaeota archaeon]|jgi:hypothetical protein|nr:hypothetical protein [Candidatus Woesearchaeota archaeon]